MTGPPYRPIDARVYPRFAGVRTFMRLPHVTDLTGVDAAVYGIPFDTAVTFRPGARFGPEAIRSASALLRPFHSGFGIDLCDALSIVDYGDLPVAPGDTEGTYRRVEEALAPVVEAGAFPLALGGDHSVTLAELRVIAGRHGPLALVQLDAHGDTWDEYFDQRYFHGTTFRRAAEEGLIDPAVSVQAGMRGPLFQGSDLDDGARARLPGRFRARSCGRLGRLRTASSFASASAIGRCSSPSTWTSSTRPTRREPARPRWRASRRRRRSPSCAR